MNCKDAIETLTKAMEEDQGYAWSWHCNIAMAFVDQGGDHDAANKAAASFMKNCFGIETREPVSQEPEG